MNIIPLKQTPGLPLELVKVHSVPNNLLSIRSHSVATDCESMRTSYSGLKVDDRSVVVNSARDALSPVVGSTNKSGRVESEGGYDTRWWQKQHRCRTCDRGGAVYMRQSGFHVPWARNRNRIGEGAKSRSQSVGRRVEPVIVRGEKVESAL
ncbi:hypothetical protein B0H14DRAFT_2866755 [Mycena olivaceomarginata]|nr:hypothetical protein B0H14DRAFT_2866755 [Mycena olivaceomarginata]